MCVGEVEGTIHASYVPGHRQLSAQYLCRIQRHPHMNT